jgi:hypothetical protein
VLAAAIEARGEDSGIVEDEAVLEFKVRREIVEEAIFPLSAGAIDHEHPRPGAVGERFLGDEIFGEVIVEVGKKHFLPNVDWKRARHVSPLQSNADSGD